MIRLFIALNIPDDVKSKLIELRNSVAGSNYKWESKEKLHLTLKFIGDIQDDLLNPIISEINFIQNFSAFDCAVTNFGFFFRDNKPNILWAGLKIDESIYELVDKIEASLEKFSIKREKRKFHPHLTLLRIKNDPGKNFVNSFKNFTFEPLVFTANSISLFKSELFPQGSKYFEIKNFNLKKLE